MRLEWSLAYRRDTEKAVFSYLRGDWAAATSALKATAHACRALRMRQLSDKTRRQNTSPTGNASTPVPAPPAVREAPPPAAFATLDKTALRVDLEFVPDETRPNTSDWRRWLDRASLRLLDLMKADADL